MEEICGVVLEPMINRSDVSENISRLVTHFVHLGNIIFYSIQKEITGDDLSKLVPTNGHHLLNAEMKNSPAVMVLVGKQDTFHLLFHLLRCVAANDVWTGNCIEKTIIKLFPFTGSVWKKKRS
ncbi:hypothetical protein CEXT_180871 [Caerostris extrusa]|uniref:Uncharacterized protein n=1 Tax=Caerostris extrusa TaxID=172846 RepID=A0AAV4X8F1_CAEEX|nr:hypothetical protein CEXT_180871 [Caerostris extrusa]